MRQITEQASNAFWREEDSLASSLGGFYKKDYQRTYTDKGRTKYTVKEIAVI